MSTAIAFLSGKGGSGKTTLALSMADLLCRCGVRTLLIDCDLSTNGATYFYESRLTERGQVEQSTPLSFSEFLHSNCYSSEIAPLIINPCLAFVPSISEVMNRQLIVGVSQDQNDIDVKLCNLLSWAKQSYDVILFDCQAGYTELLPALLPLMDMDIFVLEADSISASAMRSLHLKIGNYLGHAKLYQIFNKATPEEFEIYSKIVGTFFTNIGTLLFDWKIRQAFSRSQIPDLENNSAKYGSDLCDICKIVFSDMAIQDKLSPFSTNILYLQAEEEREQTERKLYELATKPRRLRRATIMAASITLFATLTSLLLMRMDGFLIEDSNMTIISSFAGAISVLFAISGFSVFFADYSRENRELRKGYERKLKEIDDRIMKLNRLRRDTAE